MIGFYYLAAHYLGSNENENMPHNFQLGDKVAE